MLTLVWFWADSVQARDIAVAAARNAAQQYRLQLLDATVAFSSMKFARDAYGKLRLRRIYTFEVSDTGDNRLPCRLALVGKRVEEIDIPPYQDFD